NPLFVEEMLAMVADSPGAGVVVPPTIQALLAARLDQLDPSERGVLERGAVEGKVFHRGSVEALAPEEHDISRRLMALVRKELVRPDRAQLTGDDAFRFRHLLIRDAAYEGLPKTARAELHERFADWLTERADDLIEFDEIARSVAKRDSRRELRARLVRSSIAHLGEGESAEETRPLAEEALRVFADPVDDAGLADGWYALARIEHNACRFRLRDEAVRRME